MKQYPWPELSELALSLDISQARPLSGGLTNRCWWVSSHGRQYVWRPSSESCRAFDISREHEHQLLAKIADSELAPKPHLLLPAGLLAEWLPGKAADHTLSDSELLALLAQVHRLPLPHWRLDPQQKACHYWLSIPVQQRTPQLCAIHDYFQQQPVLQWVDDCCCHHDFGRYNVIQNETGNKIIDWEYAAAGDPSLDLALTINANNLDPDQAVVKYCSQRQIEDVSRWHQAVNYWQPWCEYLALLWYLAGATIWQQADYQVAAQDLLKRLCQRFCL